MMRSISSGDRHRCRPCRRRRRPPEAASNAGPAASPVRERGAPVPRGWRRRGAVGRRGGALSVGRSGAGSAPRRAGLERLVLERLDAPLPAGRERRHEARVCGLPFLTEAAAEAGDAPRRSAASGLRLGRATLRAAAPCARPSRGRRPPPASRRPWAACMRPGKRRLCDASEARDRPALASALSVAILGIFLLDRASAFFLPPTRRRAVSIRHFLWQPRLRSVPWHGARLPSFVIGTSFVGRIDFRRSGGQRPIVVTRGRRRGAVLVRGRSRRGVSVIRILIVAAVVRDCCWQRWRLISHDRGGFEDEERMCFL